MKSLELDFYNIEELSYCDSVLVNGGEDTGHAIGRFIGGIVGAAVGVAVITVVLTANVFGANINIGVKIPKA